MRSFDRLIWGLGLVAVFLPLKHLARFYQLLPSRLGNFGPFLLMAFIAALIVVTRRRTRPLPGEVKAVLGLLVALSLAGMVIRDTNIFSLIYYLRWILYVVLFYKICYARLLAVRTRSLFRLMVMASYALSYLVYAQRIILVQIMHYWSGDIITGVFAVDYYLTFFQIFSVVIIVTFWIHGQDLGTRFSNVHLLLVITLSIAFSNNKAGFGFLLVLLGYIMWGSRQLMSRAMLRRWVGILGMGAVGLLVFNYLWTTTYTANTSLVYLADPQFIRYYYFGNEEEEGSEFAKSGALRRGASMLFSWQLLRTDMGKLLLGYGPGSTNQSDQSQLRGRLYAQYPEYQLDKVGISAQMLNMGLIGTGLYFFLLWLLYRRMEDSELPPDLVLLGKTTVVFLVLFQFYQNMPPSLLHGLVFGMLLAMQEYAREGQPVAGAADSSGMIGSGLEEDHAE